MEATKCLLQNGAPSSIRDRHFFYIGQKIAYCKIFNRRLLFRNRSVPHGGRQDQDIISYRHVTNGRILFNSKRRFRRLDHDDPSEIPGPQIMPETDPPIGDNHPAGGNITYPRMVKTFPAMGQTFDDLSQGRGKA